jgi:streptogramin lyase
VNEEFHTQLKRLDAAIGWEVFDLPRGPTENIFAAHFVADNPTRLSMLGESIVVDPSGRTWATEGGWMLYAGVHPNHSRIVMLEPDGGTPQIWPVPGDDNSVVGMTYEPATGSVWFTQAQRARREDGVTTCPIGAPHEFRSARDSAGPDFDFVPSERCELASGAHVGVCGTTRWRRCFDDDDCVLADRVCRDDAPDDNACFREYEIPTAPGETPLALPGPLLRHSDGTIWFSGYWGGNYVGRFDPATETFQRFPLARPPGETSCDLRDCVCFPPEGSRERACSLRCCLYVVLGRGPWTLVEDDGGGVAFCAQEAGAVARLPRQRFRDPRCAALGATGTNICMLEYPLRTTIRRRHSSTRWRLDGAGNLWFGESRIDGRDEDAARGASLGMFRRAPATSFCCPASLYPFTSSGAECRPAGEPVAYSAVGIAFDPRTGSVWSADYCRKRLGEITPRRTGDEP